MPLGIIVYGVSVTPRIKFCGLGKIKPEQSVTCTESYDLLFESL